MKLIKWLIAAFLDIKEFASKYKKQCKHERVEAAYFPREKQKHRKNVIMWDIYKVYRCADCKEVLKEDKVRSWLTFEDATKYMEDVIKNIIEKKQS